MFCPLCKEEKLSKEFPFKHITEECNHALLHCLKCATEFAQKNKKCTECGKPVDETADSFLTYVETLEDLYPGISDDEDDSSASETIFRQVGGHIYITTLSGDSVTLNYDSDMTIIALKKHIEGKLNAASNKQRLLYQNKELKSTDANYRQLKLKDYKIPADSKLNLVIVLYAVPEGLDHVIFDLHWGFPAGQSQHMRRQDFLDATVFLYNDSSFVDVVAFRDRCSSVTGMSVLHSGHAEMDWGLRIGHQKINVHIQSLPDCINHLVFTLSAYRSDTVSKYRTPRLKFYEAKSPDKQLCSDEMRGITHEQSIIMCSLSKKDGQWVAQRVKLPCGGNTLNYGPLKSKISSLILNNQI